MNFIVLSSINHMIWILYIFLSCLNTWRDLSLLFSFFFSFFFPLYFHLLLFLQARQVAHKLDLHVFSTMISMVCWVKYVELLMIIWIFFQMFWLAKIEDLRLLISKVLRFYILSFIYLTIFINYLVLSSINF